MSTRTADPAAPRPSMRGMLPVFIIVLVVGVVVLMGPNEVWNTILINPLINSLLLLTNLLGGQFGLAIIVFTILLRLVTIPFTLRQLQSTRAMQEVQPKMQEIQKKYKDPKRRQEEQMKLFREAGVNPLGCLWPTLVTMVFFFAMWRALAYIVGGSPESLMGLSQRVYPWIYLTESVPLEQSFLWLELGEADPTFVLPILVGLSTYVQTRLSATPATTPQQAQQTQMMTWMLPFMMVFFTMNLPSGVGVYWVASTVFQIGASYMVYGRRMTWRSLLPTAMPADNKPVRPVKKQSDDEEAPAEGEAEEPEAPSSARRRSRHGKRRGKRKNR